MAQTCVAVAVSQARWEQSEKRAKYVLSRGWVSQQPDGDLIRPFFFGFPKQNTPSPARKDAVFRFGNGEARTRFRCGWKVQDANERWIQRRRGGEICKQNKGKGKRGRNTDRGLSRSRRNHSIFNVLFSSFSLHRQERKNVHSPLVSDVPPGVETEGRIRRQRSRVDGFESYGTPQSEDGKGGLRGWTRTTRTTRGGEERSTREP